jgi:tetratricopeptide (TPR) repeat protein
MRSPGWIFAASCMLIMASAQAETTSRFPGCDDTSLDVDKRIAACSKYLEQAPAEGKDWVDIIFARGLAYKHKLNLDRAIADYSEAIRLNPARIEFYEYRYDAYFGKKDYAHAFADIDKVIAAYPSAARYYRYRASIWRSMGNAARAEMDRRKAEELGAAVQVQLKKASSCMERRDLDADRQIGVCTEALAAPEQTAEQKANSYKMRGLAYLQKGEADSAIADFSEAIRLNPKAASCYAHRGNIYQLRKDYDHAIADYSQAIALNPDRYPDFYSDRARAFLAQGDTERAKADQRRAEELSMGVNKRLAETKVSRCSRSPASDADASIAVCSEVLATPQLTDQQKAMAYQNRGAAFAQKRALDQALADFDQAIRLAPKSADLYNSRGGVYLIKKDYGRAIADYSQAIAINPDGDSVYYTNRAAAYLAQGDEERAAADSRKAKQMKLR